MNKNFIDMIQPTPIFKTKKCLLLAYLTTVLLKLLTPTTGVAIWYLYDVYLAFFALVLGFIITGILRSILRNSSIPASQLEYPYNDFAIVSWFLSKELCYE